MVAIWVFVAMVIDDIGGVGVGDDGGVGIGDCGDDGVGVVRGGVAMCDGTSGTAT